MKKYILILLMAICICTLYGCNKGENSINTEENETQKKVEKTNRIQKEYELPEEYKPIHWIEEKDDNSINALCKTEKGYALYDLQSQKEYASYEVDLKGKFMLDERFLGVNNDKFYFYMHMCKDDYISDRKNFSNGNVVSYGAAIKPGDDIRKVIALDRTLSVADEYDLNSIYFNSQDDTEFEIGIGISDSGIWIANRNQICKYNLDSLELEKLDSKIEDALDNITISQLVISEDSSKVAFLGNILDVDDSQVYGIIDVKTAKVQKGNTKTNYVNKLNKAGNIAYITDGGNPDTGKSTGEIICINMDTMEVSEYPVENLESTNACLDDEDKYVIAASQKDDNYCSTRIRAYDFHTGDVKWEYQSTDGLMEDISIVQQKIILRSFPEDGKLHIIQLDLKDGQAEG